MTVRSVIAGVGSALPRRRVDNAELAASVDDNGDFRLSTAEGLPAYGPVKVSLTKRGDTSAAG